MYNKCFNVFHCSIYFILLHMKLHHNGNTQQDDKRLVVCHVTPTQSMVHFPNSLIINIEDVLHTSHTSGSTQVIVAHSVQSATLWPT